MLVGAGFGCGNSSSTSQPDMTMTVGPDMAVKPADMMTLGCQQIISCVRACAGNTTCQGACLAEGSTTAQLQLGNLAACLFGVCGPQDGGSMMCASAQDTSQGCQSCLSSAGLGAATGGACSTQFSQCM